METTSRRGLCALQKGIKLAYRKDAVVAAFMLRARGLQNVSPLSGSVDIGHANYEAGAHRCVGGSGSGACSGDLDLRGALGVSQEVPVGFKDIRLAFDIVAPAASEQQLRILRENTEQYCVVHQTLLNPAIIDPNWPVPSPSAASATQEAR